MTAVTSVRRFLLLPFRMQIQIAREFGFDSEAQERGWELQFMQHLADSHQAGQFARAVARVETEPAMCRCDR